MCKKLSFFLSSAILSSFVVGCSKVEKPVEFEPNIVMARALEQKNDFDMTEAMSTTQATLLELFGTPDDPKLPKQVAEDEDLASVVDLESVKLAAGPVSENGGLYRKHLCVTCHGITGNGRGTLGATLATYPRDYRLGLFKFKSTDGSSKPTRDDLRRVIKNGIPGTGMDPVPGITDADIDALVEYVIYLSWRGELEYKMLYLADELFAPLERDEDMTDEEWKEEQADWAEEQQEWISELVIEIAEDWQYAEDEVFEVPERPEFPVPETVAEVVAAEEGSELAASIAAGREVFLLEIASCTKCHGNLGHGDGQGKYFDNWTEAWTKKMGLDPTDEDSLIPYIARGALPPKYINPRDFREGVFRGGSEPEDLYRKIACGICGTPMPAVKGNLKPDQIWQLVNYVRSLAVLDDASSAPAADEDAAAND